MKGLIDSTLREGAQTVGVSFSFQQKIAIVKALADIGIEEIEIGLATRFDPELKPLMHECRKFKSPTQLSVWSLCRKEDIDYAAALNPDVLSLSLPASDRHITKKLNKSRQWCLDTLAKAVLYAKDLGIRKISLGLEDATRADPDFIQQLIKRAEKSGVARIRLADTVGIATPATIHKLISSLIANCSLEIGVHNHNDFGMATANSITALDAGAHWADVTVLGLGERTGNARTEEVAGFLALQNGRSYRTEKLKALCSLVSKAASRQIAPHQPVIGNNIFACETGLHLQGLEQDPATYEPYNPKQVGTTRHLIYGQKTGRHSLGKRLTNLNLPATPEFIEKTFQNFRTKTQELGRPLEDTELIALCSR